MENKMNEERFKSQKSICSYKMEVSASASIVFPLLCPIREYDWIDGWKCDLIYSDSGVAEKLCVFKTNTPLFGDETWVCTRYEINQILQYTRFSDNKIVMYDIVLSENYDTKSSWIWTLSILSLNETGNNLIKKFNQELMYDKLKGFNILLEHFVKTGQKLTQ